FEQNGKVSLSAARYDAYRGDVDYNTPLSDDFAIRFVGFYEDAESFRDEIEKEAYGVSPSIVWNISDRSRLVYELEYSDQEVPFDRGVVAINDQLGRIPESRFLGEPGDGPMKAKVVGHQVEWQYDINDDWSALLGFNYRDTSLKGFSTEAELSGSRQKLYVDGETLTRQRRSRDYDATYEVLRAEVTGSFHTGGLEHRIMVGADVDEFENDQVFLRIRAPSLSTNPTDQQLQAINVFDPIYGQYPLPTPLPQTDRVETQESFGVFLQDQISLTEQLDVRIGVRYDDYEQKLKDRLNDTQADQSEDRWSPQVGAVYEATEELSFYAVYGENFRPLSGVDAQGNGFDPNKTESIEAGIKVSLINGALEGTLAVYQIEQNNIVVVDDPSAFTQAAIGEAESKGAELDIAGRLGESTSIWLSYAYVDAETKNAFFDANFGREIPAGTELLNIPKNQLNLQIAYDFTLGGRKLQFGGGLLYVDDRSGYFGTDFTLPDYTLVNAFAAYNLTDAFLARLEIQNLFDEEYYTNSFADLWVEPGAPTTWRVVAEYTF
ncbi:MAG: TonB-dependent siderophore receptor, partial [Pseudomonadota bacterium]